MVQVTNFPPDKEEENIETVVVHQSTSVPNPFERRITVTDEAYRLIAGGMMADPIRPTNPIVAMAMLDTALMNRNVPLAKHYIASLHQLIQKDNALKMLISIGKWVHTTEAHHPLHFEPSAPSLAENEEERNDNWMKEPLAHLRDQILLEIDKHGDFFLKQEEIRDLHYRDLLDITTRDTLQVSKEQVVYVAIMRWATMECVRLGLSPSENFDFKDDLKVRVVLKDLFYAPRYGLMKKKEFRARMIDGFRGPDRMGMDTQINETIIKYLTQKEKKKKNNDELPYKMSIPRKKEDRKMSENEQPMKEKVIINCLTCFSAVFD